MYCPLSREMTSQPSTLHRALESWDWISKMVHFYVGPLPSAKLAKVCIKQEVIDYAENYPHPKAELLQEGTFFLVHLLARAILVMKK